MNEENENTNDMKKCIPGSDGRESRGFDRMLELLKRKTEPTPSERIIQLSKQRDYIYDRLKEWEEEHVHAAEIATGYEVELYHSMKQYKDALTAAIQHLLENT